MAEELTGEFEGALPELFDPATGDAVAGATARGRMKIRVEDAEIAERVDLSELVVAALAVAIDEVMEGRASLLEVRDAEVQAAVVERLLPTLTSDFAELEVELLGLEALEIDFPADVAERLEAAAAAGDEPSETTEEPVAPPAPMRTKSVKCRNCGANIPPTKDNCEYCDAPAADSM